MKRALLFVLLALPLASQVPYERIRRAEAEPGNWLTYSGNYFSHRFSSLKQITTANAVRLKPAWVYQIEARHKFETTPLVVDGVMYITEPPSDATALDVRTGRPLWKYRRTIPDDVIVCCGKVNRGAAILDDLLFLGTVDGHLVALDAGSGVVRWDVAVIDYKTAHSITGAPLVVKDKVVLGIAGGEYGVRGFVDAYEAKTGKRAWRFWTVPGPGEPGFETWAGDSWKTGAATTWVTGSYDPELNLIYWGVGNPGPDWNGDVRRGDNLYSDCLLALDADTGKLKWYFQFTPHDVHDWDATQVPVLVDAVFRGKRRKLILFANRNGFYYVLDRQTGEFLTGTPFIKQTWAKGLDEKGRPIRLPNTFPTAEGTLVYPHVGGGTNWFSPSYNPATKLFYVAAQERVRCSTSVNRNTGRAPVSTAARTARSPAKSLTAPCVLCSRKPAHCSGNSACTRRPGPACSLRPAAWSSAARWKATSLPWTPKRAICYGSSRPARVSSPTRSAT